MNRYKSLLGDRAVIGMVHLRPLPGSPRFDGDMRAVLEAGLNDALALTRGGVTALMVENAGDEPFGQTISLAQAAALASATQHIRERVSVPVGIDAAFCDYRAALACAKAACADFVRLAVYVDVVVGACGVMQPCCAAAVAYRSELKADEVLILADVQVKHSRMLLSGVPIEESARNAVGNGADAVIVTGTHTGEQTPMDLVRRVKAAVDVPVIVGSGASAENIRTQLKIADGAIVGSSLKQSGVFTNPVDERRVKELMAALGKGDGI